MTGTMSTDMNTNENTNTIVTPERRRGWVDQQGEGEGAPVCPPAPRRRQRSPSESVEAAAFDAAIRRDSTVLDDLPAPTGLPRQQAVSTDATPVCTPFKMDSPVGLFCVAPPTGLIDEEETLLERRDTDTGDDLLVSESDVEGDDEGSDGDDEGSEEGSEEGDDDDDDDEEKEVTNTDGLISLGLRQRESDGYVSLSIEAPVWLWSALMAVVTAYWWMIVYISYQKRGN